VARETGTSSPPFIACAGVAGGHLLRSFWNAAAVPRGRDWLRQRLATYCVERLLAMRSAMLAGSATGGTLRAVAQASGVWLLSAWLRERITGFFDTNYCRVVRLRIFHLFLAALPGGIARYRPQGGWTLGTVRISPRAAVPLLTICCCSCIFAACCSCHHCGFGRWQRRRLAACSLRRGRARCWAGVWRRRRNGRSAFFS